MAFAIDIRSFAAMVLGFKAFPLHSDWTDKLEAGLIANQKVKSSH
jgi:hypothetical protein